MRYLAILVVVSLSACGAQPERGAGFTGIGADPVQPHADAEPSTADLAEIAQGQAEG